MGFRGGLLIGNPDVPVVLSANVSLLPSLEVWAVSSGSSWNSPDEHYRTNLTLLTLGLSVGLYVPFLDLN